VPGVAPLPVEDDVLGDMAVSADDVVNSERPDSWNAIVIGCAHIVNEPQIAVKRADVPSRVEVNPSVVYPANTVAAPALLGRCSCTQSTLPSYVHNLRCSRRSFRWSPCKIAQHKPVLRNRVVTTIVNVLWAANRNRRP
jgi:hypothetical protein